MAAKCRGRHAGKIKADEDGSLYLDAGDGDFVPFSLRITRSATSETLSLGPKPSRKGSHKSDAESPSFQ